MIKSMTGFGRKETELSGNTIAVEVRSVNSRYLDINMRLPEILSLHENTLKRVIGEYCERGQVSVKVSTNGSEEKWSRITVNSALLENYDRLFTDIQENLSLASGPTVSDYINLPDIIQYEQNIPEESQLLEQVTTTLRGAMQDVVSMRTKEGASLSQDMAERLEWLEKSLQTIESQAEDNAALAKQSLENRINELLGDVQVNQDRLAQEIAYIADKIDITEETVRLRSHIKQFQNLLDKDTSVGKKLNFLLQEMNREVNTIGAKANNSDISHIIVDCKNEIEKLREQVQNIE